MLRKRKEMGVERRKAAAAVSNRGENPQVTRPAVAKGGRERKGERKKGFREYGDRGK
jgi:hypothetical protein